MANTYGGSSKRQKVCYDNDGIKACNEFFSVTNLETNKTEWHQDTTVRLGGMWGLQGPETSKIIGTYDPKTKKFTPNEENILASQKKFFTSQEGTKLIGNNTITTNTKSGIENGLSAEAARQRALEISEGNYEHVDPNADPNNKSPSTESGAKPIPTRNNYGTHYYPLDIAATDQDVIKIDIIRYAEAGLGGNERGFGPKDREKPGSGDRTILGSVILPIPGGIKDNNSVDWGDTSLNAVQLTAAQVAWDLIGQGDKEIGGNKKDIFGDFGAKLGANTSEIKKGLAQAFTAAAIGKDFNALSARGTGEILNPNMELLFKSPALRPFDFSFLLAPRSKEESAAVAQIIRFFKQGMAVQKTSSNLFLKSPNTFQLTYKHRGAEGSDHPYLNKFKECALKSCSVNYTPDQAYSTYIDGAMTAYTMTLSFQELTPLYEDDYEEDETTASTESVPSAIGF